MKTMLCMMGVLFVAGSAAANDRQDAMESIGEAVAFSVACPDAKLNSDNLDLAAIEYGIDMVAHSSDSATINAVSSHRMNVYRAYAQATVCMVAIDLFGPNGRRMPNLLVDER